MEVAFIMPQLELKDLWEIVQSHALCDQMQHISQSF